MVSVSTEQNAGGIGIFGPISMLPLQIATFATMVGAIGLDGLNVFAISFASPSRRDAPRRCWA